MESICFYGILPEVNDYLERTLKDTGIYTRLFQDYGNNIRAFGKAICGSNEKISAENIFVMPERVNRVLKLLRHHGKLSDKRKRSNPVFVVINNFKNIFEAFYFRCRYSSFYLLSVACDEDERRQCFDTSTEYHLTDLKENLSLGKKFLDVLIELLMKMTTLAKWIGLGILEQNIRPILVKQNFYFKADLYWRKCTEKTCYRNNLENIILQDVTTCIENADIF